MRISQKLFVTLAATIALTVASILGLLYLKSKYELENLVLTYGESLAAQVAQFAAEPLFAKDLLSLNVVVNQLESAKFIEYAAVLDINQKPLAEIGTQPNSKQAYFIKPIRFQSSVEGYGVVAIDQSKVMEAIKGSGILLLLLAGASLLLGAVLISAVVRHLIDGINTTTFAFRQLAQGELGTQIKIHRNDELGALITGFNELSQGLKERDQLLRPEPAKPMAQHAERDFSDGYVHITHMFVDLSELNRHIEKLSADGCTHLINVYNQLIQLAVHHYDCDSCRFDRNGLSVRFLASDLQDASNSCLDAICASQLILRLVDRLNQSRFERHLPTIRVSIGLHQSFGFITQVRQSLQHDRSGSYNTIFGDGETDAFHLARLASRGRVAISTSALDIANANQVIQTSEIHTHPMTDFTAQIKFTTITGLSPQLRKPIQIQADELFQTMYPRVLLSEHTFDKPHARGQSSSETYTQSSPTTEAS